MTAKESITLDNAHKLANEHWEYIELLLATNGTIEDQIRIIGFHYKSAFIHGYKHGQVDKGVE